MATIKDAIKEIVDELRNVRDIRKIFDAPEDAANRFPMAWVLPDSGEFQKQSAGWIVGLHNISIEFAVKATDLPRSFMTLLDIFDRIPNQLETGLEAGRFSAVTTWRNITYDRRNELWENDLRVCVISFVMNDVKVLDTVST
jgi:hypothetical protein